MGKFLINGGRQLRGKINVGGSKNAALPMIFASIIAADVSKITNIPDIGDTRVAFSIIEQLGAKVRREGRDVFIDCREMRYTDVSVELVQGLRASTYLIGACLARFGRMRLSDFGGCNFSPRPIDMHIASALSFGALLDGVCLTTDKLVGTDIFFDKPSVGATVNSLIMACAAEGESRIFGGAEEPHIIALIDFLRSMGANIEITPECITVCGSQLRGGITEVGGDMIEAGTFLTLSALTGGGIITDGFCLSELNAFIEALSSGGCTVKTEYSSIRAIGYPTHHISVTAAPYPGFPTDLQPIVASLMAVGAGGEICDTVFPLRFGYLRELKKLGLNYEKTGGGVKIMHSSIHSGSIDSVDLRGGAAGVLLALYTEGQSVINSAQTVLRGYENLIEKLKNLGAQIEYFE